MAGKGGGAEEEGRGGKGEGGGAERRKGRPGAETRRGGGTRRAKFADGQPMGLRLGGKGKEGGHKLDGGCAAADGFFEMLRQRLVWRQEWLSGCAAEKYMMSPVNRCGPKSRSSELMGVGLLRCAAVKDRAIGGAGLWCRGGQHAGETRRRPRQLGNVRSAQWNRALSNQRSARWHFRRCDAAAAFAT